MDYYFPSKPCCVIGCFDRKSRRYRIPILNENIKKIWLQRINNPALMKLENNQLHNVRICGVHFLPVCKRKMKLFSTSLPTINVPGFSGEPNIGNSFFKDEVLFTSRDVGKTNENDSTENNNTTAVSNQSNVENKNSVQSNNNVPIDLPNVSTQVKNNITLPDPLEIEPVEKVTYSILAKELTSKSRVTSSIQNKYIDDDIQIIETNDVVIDLCDDETNDAAPTDTISIPETVDNDIAAQDTSAARKDTFSLTPDNLGMICRTCLKQKDVVNLNEHKYEELTFADILEMCAPVKLKEDTTLSQNICKTCINELLQTYHFRLKCEKSEQILSTFKTELAKSQARKKCLQDRYKNLSLRFHDYESILNEEDVQQITHPKRHDHDISTTETVFPKDDKSIKKRFYLVKGCADGKTGLKLSEIDENNAKALMNDTGQAAMTVRVGNAVCNLTKGVLQPGQEITDAMKDNLKNALVRNLNKRKMIAYSQLIKPAIRSIMTGRFTPNACLLRPKKPKKPRKRKMASDKPKYRKPVIPGVCETCNEPLNTLDEYKEHVKVTKHYLNPHVCKECGNVYGDRYRLKTHWLINHQENKLHMCDICGKCYKTRNYLNLHLKSHSNVNKRGEYVCKQCGNIYGTFRDLITHKRKVHPSIEKEHCCEYCGDFFSSKGTLRHHRNRVHLKIKHEFCQICGKGLSRTSIYRILDTNSMHPYAYKILQSLKPEDYERRIVFCEFLLTKIQTDPMFLRKIIWTDESKFSREGIINRKNLHFWANKNPHVVREAHFQNTFSFNIFVLVMGDRIAYEIYDENLNSDRYLQILRNTVSNFCDNLPLNILPEVWYQLDGAPAHSSAVVQAELTAMFEDRWIGNNGPWKWPPRSPDLTPLDFYFWGYLKSLVYATPVRSREDLLHRVTTNIRTIPRNQIIKATGAVEARILRCLENNGGHVESMAI